MIGILVTRFKMGLVDVEGLELMAANATSEARCLAARKVLEALSGAAWNSATRKWVTYASYYLERQGCEWWRIETLKREAELLVRNA
jgi:hypothetical protein